MKRIGIALLLLAGSIGTPGARAAGGPCIQRMPVDLAILLDRSGSVTPERLDAMRNAAARITEPLSSGDRTALITFADRASVDAPLSADHNATRAALATIIPGGLTATGGALELARAVLSTAQREGARRAVVVITDGPSNAGPDPIAVAATLRGTGIEIFTIGTGDANQYELSAIASDPDERYAFAAGSSLEAPAEDVARDLMASSIAGEAFALSVDASASALGSTGATVRKVAQSIAPPGGRESLRRFETTAGSLMISFEAAGSAADGSAVPSSASARASARISNLDVRDVATGLLLIGADAIEVSSSSAAKRDDAASAGGATFTGLHVAGQAGTVEPTANMEIPLPGGKLVLDERDTSLSADGVASRRVTALHLLIADGGTLDISIGSAWSGAACGNAPAWSDPQRATGDPATATVDRSIGGIACRRALADRVCDAIPEPDPTRDPELTCRLVFADDVCDRSPRP